MFVDILDGIRALQWMQKIISPFYSTKDIVPADFQAEQRRREEKAIQNMLDEALVMWVTAFGQVRFFYHGSCLFVYETSICSGFGQMSILLYSLVFDFRVEFQGIPGPTDHERVDLHARTTHCITMHAHMSIFLKLCVPRLTSSAVQKNMFWGPPAVGQKRVFGYIFVQECPSMIEMQGWYFHVLKVWAN